MPVIRQQLDNGETVRFLPRGISMLPMLRQGRDAVILSPLPEKLKKYDLPLYRRDDGHYVLHRIIRVGKTYTCMGDNQLDPEPGVRHDQMIGLVTAFTRDNQVVSVNAWQYRLYCRVWPLAQFARKCWRKIRMTAGRLIK